MNEVNKVKVRSNCHYIAYAFFGTGEQMRLAFGADHDEVEARGRAVLSREVAHRNRLAEAKGKKEAERVHKMCNRLRMSFRVIGVPNKPPRYPREVAQFGRIMDRLRAEQAVPSVKVGVLV